MLNAPVYSEFKNVLIYSSNNTLYINNLKERTKITCFDISGRIIFENFSENNFNKQLSKGIYLIKLENKNGNNQVFKCIVH
ncbi:MAG: T9SS type A sorting domain-containing protein [Tannerella sp.]|nr:T9SS type A sorting domain-containing protein [Tannerella sp.]